MNKKDLVSIVEVANDLENIIDDSHIPWSVYPANGEEVKLRRLARRLRRIARLSGSGAVIKEG